MVSTNPEEAKKAQKKKKPNTKKRPKPVITIFQQAVHMVFDCAYIYTKASKTHSASELKRIFGRGGGAFSVSH